MYTASQLNNYKNGTRKHNMMNSISAMLSDTEINDLSEYISSLY